VLTNATADDVKRTFAQLKSQLDPNNVLFVFLIGHGSFDGKESKFNLVGPDFSAAEYNALLASLPTQRVVVFNMSSASGEFAKSLSAKGRIVVTATRNGQESNATHFPGFFIAALNAKDADTDQDGHTSVLEAFLYANRLTADFYTRAGRLATEHALLEDNGDGVGSRKSRSRRRSARACDLSRLVEHRRSRGERRDRKVNERAHTSRRRDRTTDRPQAEHARGGVRGVARKTFYRTGED
jgi:hypothetical protein